MIGTVSSFVTSWLNQYLRFLGVGLRNQYAARISDAILSLGSSSFLTSQSRFSFAAALGPRKS
jgi:hypothetical protein